ncbi:hypothetical protein PG985_009575 [Apiospora marii]|uniref:Clr5 domain-containing protein n=1 Tax=Apiospora marii TaxID=335849 RepID=A0ABR1RFL5_9PEZI
MSSKVIYADQPKDYSLWDAHKDVLKDLFLTQKRPLRKVKELMESEYGFPRSLTLSTYETTLRNHFGFRKNLKREYWEAISTHLEKRQGKKNEVTFLGDLLTHKRVTKEVNRYCSKTSIANVPRRATPALPDSIFIRTLPPASPEAVPDPQWSGNAFERVPMIARAATRTYLITRLCSDITQGFSNTPSDTQHELGHLLQGRLSRERMNLPINQLAGKIVEALSHHHDDATEDMLRSLAYLHQMTGSPKTFGLNNSLSLLLNASYMLSNRYLEWELGGPFLQWFGKVADIHLLRRFFSQDTPTTIATWCSIIRLATIRLESYDMVASIWFEIGLTACEGRLLRDNTEWCLELVHLMSPRMGWNTWKHISKVVPKVLGGQWPEYNLQVMSRFICESINDPALTKDVIDSSENLPKTICLSCLEPRQVAECNMDCIKMLVEAGMTFDLGSGGLCYRLRRFLPRYTQGETLERAWLKQLDQAAKFVDLCTGLLGECVTVLGICAAASRGLEALREYVQGKRHPVPHTDTRWSFFAKNELLQIALSETVGMGLRSIVEVLLQHGVDVEGKDLDPGRYRRPALEAVDATDLDMIALLANHGADFNSQDILDVVIDCTRIESNVVDPADSCEALVDLLVDVGLSLQEHGPATLISALGFFRDPYNRPDYALIRVLQKHGVSWDENFFKNGKHAKVKLWPGQGIGGVDSLQVAIRNGCHIYTIQYLLDRGLQMHSRPCELDGKSILRDALAWRGGNRIELIGTLLDHLGTDREKDPVWPSLLELSMAGVYPGGSLYDRGFESELELFHYVKTLGAALPLPTDPVKAQRRFDLIPKLFLANAQYETVQEVWNHGEGFEKLHDGDRDQLLLETIKADAFIWACTLIEHGANVNGEVPFEIDCKDVGLMTPVQFACMSGNCSLQLFRYLLEHGGRTTFPGTTGLTALHIAALEGNLNLGNLILENHANFNAVWTPDCPQKDNSYYEELITLKSREGEEDEKEWILSMFTPLDVAASMGRLDMVKFLLNVGGRSAIPGPNGFDGALKVARKKRHPGIVMLLKETNGSPL